MAILTSLLLCALPQAPPPVATVHRIPDGVRRPKLDGHPKEEFWSKATLLSGFVQTLPVAGTTPSQQTEIRMCYDDTDLYIALFCYDTEPSEIRATQTARDANLDPDDRVEMLLDTFGDKRSGFWFQLGPGSSKGDSLISRGGQDFNKRWDTIWYAKSSITDEGWFGEIRIPFASISFDPQQPNWGFNARRFIRRHDEETRWASPDPRLRFFQPAIAGELRGFHGQSQGLGLDVVPFFVGTHLNSDEQGEHWLGDSGFDAFYKLSPSTKLSLSYNTDFAETEVDSRRVNLSRFPLFFPEKRKFFLEDSGVFGFGPGGSGGTDPLPFFSRRIGLDSNGNEVPLLLNGKVTAATDSYKLGILDSQTENSGDTQARNLFVGRYTKNILEQSSVGVIYTRGNPNGSTEDFTVGADLNLQTTSFMEDHTLRFKSYVIATESEESAGENLAYSAKLEYPNDEIASSIGFTEVQSNFDPALGFVRQQGIQRYDANYSYFPRMYSDIRRLRFSVTPYVIYNTEERATEVEQLTLLPLGIDWESGETLRFNVYPNRTRLFEEFEIQDGIVIPTGQHETTRYQTNFKTSDKRDFSTDLRYTGGGFYDGDRNDYGVGFEWRHSSKGSIEVDYSHNDIRLPAGDFQVNVVALRADTNFTPRISWSNNVQWDDSSDNLGLNSRLRVILEPGRDLFFVFNQGWSTFDDSITPTETDARFKVSYTFRF